MHSPVRAAWSRLASPPRLPGSRPAGGRGTSSGRPWRHLGLSFFKTKLVCHRCDVLLLLRLFLAAGAAAVLDARQLDDTRRIIAADAATRASSHLQAKISVF